MTDITDDWLVRYQAEMDEKRKRMPRMKEALLDALKAGGIASVTVQYDGEGDSGQINHITAHDAAGKDVKMRGSVTLDLSVGPRRYKNLTEAVDDFTWEVLDLYQYGFENNDGGFGALSIDVAKGTITLDHNDRFVDVSNTLTEV